MNIYDEITLEQIFEPDLKKGCLYDGQIKTGTEPEKRVVMEGTVTERNPEGLEKIIPAKDIYEDCQKKNLI